MSERSPRLRGWRQTLGLSGMLFFLVAGLSLVPVIRDWEVRLTDTLFRLRPAPKQRSQVVLIAIDDPSLQAYGRWPWSRALLARLTDNLAQAGAGTIGLDILLSEPQSPEDDRSLQESLRAAGWAVIADKIGTFPDGPHWIEPLPEFAQAAAAVGHAHAVMDVDSVCRRFPPRELTLDGPRWAFAVELARRTDPQRTAAFLSSHGIPLADDSPAVSTAKPVLIRIAFRRDGFDTISARTALEGLNPEAVRGRPVLVGFGPTEISDRLSTPLTTEYPTSGVEVHAQILDSILTGRTLRDLPLWISAVLLLATCILVVIAFRKWRGFTAVGVLILMGIGIYVFALLIFVWPSRVLPAGSMMLAVIAGPLLVFSADFVVVERSLTKQLLGLRSWLALRGKDHSEQERADLSWRLELLLNLQSELGSLYELHKALLESTQDLVAIFDQRGNLLLKNKAFAAVGLFKAEIALTLEQFRCRLVLQDGSALVSDGSLEEGEVYLGKELYSLRIAPLPPTTLSPQGGTIVTLTSLRTRVERDRARAEALGFITHELRTPISSIQGFAELMMHYPDSPSCAGAPETIFRESKRLLALISSYLDVLRLDAGAKPAGADVVELNGIVQQVFDILQPLATAAGMRLVPENREPVLIVGDAPLISGAVLNLVSNAIKYGRAGSDIRVRCSRQQDEAAISVYNLGQPIAPEEISRLFDSYYRAPNVESSTTGWGLGLAFVKRIAEKHGGSVRAQSQPSGTLFEIRLPAKTEVAVAAKETS
jgi:CHASE2 domain-containing sensor protein/two-component sensor histidine kinase